MRLLFDTNILLPILHETLEDLPPGVQEVVSQAGADRYVSVASLWEIAIKVRLGKLGLRPSLSLLPSLLRDLGIASLTIEAAHVLAELDPMPDTRDPFDRLLLAQCQVEGMRLVTTDRVLNDHPIAYRPA
jgi:PIN domain nuclease of toxin-antitoxin system